MQKQTLINIYRAYEGLYGKTIRYMEDMLHNPVKKRSSEHPTKYIHIGYPKAASTALQKGFFGRHRQLYHLGAGAKHDNPYWDDHGYINEEINIAVEIDFRYRNNLSYDPEKVRGYFSKHFDIASKDTNIHAVGISNENLCFNWHGGIDISDKVSRLSDVFGNETKIIVVLRNQKSLIESLYKENVRFGYAGTYTEYLKYLWTYKDRNYLYELCYDKVIDIFSDYFKNDNISLLFFEELKKNSVKFVKDLSIALGVDNYTLKLSKEYNKQLSHQELFIKRALNEKYPHTFGKGTYDAIDTHRFIPYFTSELKDQIGDDVFEDYYTRKQLIELSKVLSEKTNSPEIELGWDNKYGEAIMDFYSSSNNLLSNKQPNVKNILETFKYLELREL